MLLQWELYDVRAARVKIAIFIVGGDGLQSEKRLRNYLLKACLETLAFKDLRSYLLKAYLPLRIHLEGVRAHSRLACGIYGMRCYTVSP